MIVLALALSLSTAPDGFVETRIKVPASGTRIALRDMNGDGASDLLRINKLGLSVSFLEDGAFPVQPQAFLSWPAEDLAWDLSDIDGDGTNELVGIVDSGSVRAWSLDASSGSAEGRVLIDKVEAHLPRGRRHMRFVRDVDGDGRNDLIVPGAGRYRIHIADGGGWKKPIDVSFEARIDYEVGERGRLDDTFGISVDVPWFRLEDIDGDGRTDLVSETEEVAQFHLADPELSAEPTWRLDKKALEGDGGSPEIDFDDLFAAIGDRVDWSIEDLDGEGARDLIVQQGSTFKIYLGGARTGIGRTPDGLLKSSGQVLFSLFDDRTGDGRPELLMFRAEKLSVGRVVRWLVLPGSLDFDVFVYENKGGTFGRKPLKRLGISIGIPRLLSFFEELEETTEEFGEILDIPTTRADLDGDGVRDDVIDVVGSEIHAYADCAPPEAGLDWRHLDEFDFDAMIENFLLEQLEGLDDGDVASLDLGDIKEIDVSPADELRRSYAGRKPLWRQPLASLPPPPGEGEEELEPGLGVALSVVDIDGDGRSDVVAFMRGGESDLRTIQFLVTR